MAAPAIRFKFNNSGVAAGKPAAALYGTPLSLRYKRAEIAARLRTDDTVLKNRVVFPPAANAYFVPFFFQRIRANSFICLFVKFAIVFSVGRR